MKSQYVNVPASAAEEIAEKYNKDQVIIIAWEEQENRTYVTTFGKTKEDCKLAAEGGNLIKKYLGWPDEKRHAKPKSKSGE